MSEPTIEDVVSREYWRDRGHDPMECMGFATGAEFALDTVLRELDRNTNGRAAVDIAMATVSLRERIRAALGDKL